MGVVVAPAGLIEAQPQLTVPRRPPRRVHPCSRRNASRSWSWSVSSECAAAAASTSEAACLRMAATSAGVSDAGLMALVSAEGRRNVPPSGRHSVHRSARPVDPVVARQPAFGLLGRGLRPRTPPRPSPRRRARRRPSSSHQQPCSLCRPLRRRTLRLVHRHEAGRTCSVWPSARKPLVQVLSALSGFSPRDGAVHARRDRRIREQWEAGFGARREM